MRKLLLPLLLALLLVPQSASAFEGGQSRVLENFVAGLAKDAGTPASEEDLDRLEMLLDDTFDVSLNMLADDQEAALEVLESQYENNLYTLARQEARAKHKNKVRAKRWQRANPARSNKDYKEKLRTANKRTEAHYKNKQDDLQRQLAIKMAQIEFIAWKEEKKIFDLHDLGRDYIAARQALLP